MRKRILSILLALCLVLTLLPSIALAGDPFTTLTDSDGTQHLLFEDYGRTGTGDDSGPGWSWDGKNRILTLNGYTGKRISSDNISKLVLADGSVNRLERMALFGYTDIDGVTLPVTIEGTGELIICGLQVDYYGTKKNMLAFQTSSRTSLIFGSNLGMTGGTNEGDSGPLAFVEHEAEKNADAGMYATTSAGEKAYYVRIASTSSSSSSSNPATTPAQPAITEKPTTSTGFTDVADNAWYREAVEYVRKPANNSVDYGLMDGTASTTFSPNANADRATIVTALFRKSGDGGVFVGDGPDSEFVWASLEKELPYSDVSRDLFPAVWWANNCNITSGYGNGRFGPDDPVTREQFAVFLYRYAQEKYSRTHNDDKYELSARANLSKYADSTQISSWAVDAMSWANARGFITGTTDTTLNPKGNVTRAEVAMILMRAMVI